MQAKKTICSPTWAGIDVSKESFDAAIYLPVKQGSMPRSIMDLPKKTFPRSGDGVKAFALWTVMVRDKAGLEGGNMRIVMEATGRYSLELYSFLAEELPFTEPAIENPKTIKHYIKSLKIRNKTDRIDAGAIARYGVERMPEGFSELPEEYQYLRELSRQRRSICDQLVAATARLAELQKFKKIIKIQKSLVKALDNTKQKIEQEIKDHIRNSLILQEDVEYASSVPGIALIASATILGECGPLYLHSSRQLGSYSGLAPCKKESGKSVRGSRISREGPGGLRQVLYMASVSATESNPEMAKFYKRLIAKGKTPLQARCAVMRKLLILVRAVVVNKSRYSKNYLQNNALCA
jgi:transposase